MVVATSIAAPTGAEYRGVFQEYVARSTEVLSGQLQNFEGLLSQEIQARVWLTLSYGLRLNWAWPSTRDLLLTVAPKMEQGGMWDDWLPCLAQGIERSQHVGDNEAEAELSLHLGHLLFRVGEPAAARKWLEQSERLFAHLGRPRRRAVALGRLSNLVYRAYASPEEARRLLDRAFALLAHNDPEAAFCCFVGGNLALEQHDLDEATEFFIRAQSLADEADNRRLNALALLNLGRIYQQKSLYEPAEQYYEWAISAFEGIEDPVNLAVGRLNLGTLYMMGQEPAKALRRYQEAETTLRRCHGDRRYLAMVYNNRGMAYAELADWSRAEQAYLAGISLWRELDNSLARLNVEDNLGCVYLEQGDLEKAASVFASALDELNLLRHTTTNEAGCEQLHAELSTHWRAAAGHPEGDRLYVDQSSAT